MIVTVGDLYASVGRAISVNAMTPDPVCGMEPSPDDGVEQRYVACRV
jgi:hypothetical protein